MRRIATSLFLAAAALAAPVGGHAQAVWHGGFFGGGRGGSDDRLVDARYSFHGGYEARVGNPYGFHLGARSEFSYTRFRADLGAYLDSLGATTGERTEGVDEEPTTTGTGVELLAGYAVGRVSVHGFYGWHWWRDFRPGMVLDTDQGEFTFSTRVDRDFGPGFGAGASLHVGPSGGVYAEWSRGGGRDRRMRQVDGVRFGVFWGFR